MRAIFEALLNNDSKQLVLEGESHEHLKVVRVRVGEEIQLLNGNGLVGIGKIVDVQKRATLVELEKVEQAKPFREFHLAIGLTKKDAFDLCLKMAVELGAASITPILSEYSQRYELNFDRVQRLLVQALEQSNNPWLPKVHEPQSIEDWLNIHSKSQILCMDVSDQKKTINLSNHMPIHALIGPEGGFSESERNRMRNTENIHFVSLDCPILRTPTALAALGGIIFTK